MAAEPMSLRELAARVRECTICTDMHHAHVLGQANGRPGAAVMFIGEAPGRLGAARTGVPFTGDRSGLRFQRLLQACGLRREDVFITNAVLCNPLRGGRNRPPRAGEIARCGLWLREQIALVRPRIVVTLGAAALGAACAIAPHGYRLAADGGRALPWEGRVLVPLYHPSPRTAGRRPFERQLADFRRLGQIAREASAAHPDSACR